MHRRLFKSYKPIEPPDLERLQHLPNVRQHEKSSMYSLLAFFSKDSNSTLKNHISHPHCEALKRAAEPGQSSMSRDESIFVYNLDVLREQFAGLVIQRGLPFNHFDDEQTTRLFQKHLQQKYNHAKETMFPVLYRMAMDILSVQATSVASEFAFSTSGRVLSIQRTRLTLASLEMCMCLKDHLNAQERKQDKSTLETPVDFEEEILDAEVQANEVIPLSDEETAIDAASSEGFSSFEASSSGTKEIKFVKAQKKASSDGGPINIGRPQNNYGPPSVMPGFEKSYSQNSKAYIILNKHTRKVEESLNVIFDETPPPSKKSPLVDDDLDEEEAIKESRNHALENVIGNLNQRTLRSQAQNQSNFFCFISTIEPKNVNEALTNDSWIVAMQEELNLFTTNNVWELVSQPRNMKIIGTEWVFRNKLDENGIVSRNNARLVAQGYNQQEGIDYDETYAPVARLESIRILLAYACALDFKIFQTNAKSAFLNGFINEEVYVAQPPGFIDFEKPNHVYKLKKALYGLKQAPKAWYDRLKAFLIKHEYKMGMVDNTLFTKKKNSNLIIVQIYVDDIIFGSTFQDMCDKFAKILHDEFEMSMMGELNFFLGLQIKQIEDGIFFNQFKYIKEMLKKFSLEESKPHASDTKLTKDEECQSVDSTKYQGMIGSLLYLTTNRPISCLVTAFVSASKRLPKSLTLKRLSVSFDTLKSTSGFVGCCLTSWFSNKQTVLAISTTEAEYVSAGKACQQVLWMKQALIDYDVRIDDVSIMCDNTGAIDLSKNPVQHSRTKHIKICHHSLRDNVQKGHISIEKVPFDDNIADILMKPLKRESFNYLRLSLGMMEHIPYIVLVRFYFFCLNSSLRSIPRRDNLTASSEAS
nr:hypothetical protein [Tanacetum cinerariifolium]